jgi:hypothetical protein
MASKAEQRRRPRRKVVGTGYLSSGRDVSEFRPPPGARGIKFPKRSQGDDDKK